MDIRTMLADLQAERGRIDEAIAVLQRMAMGQGKRRGRPPTWMKQSQDTPRRGRPPRSKNKVNPDA